MSNKKRDIRNLEFGMKMLTRHITYNKLMGTARKGGAISSFLISISYFSFLLSHLLFVSCTNDDGHAEFVEKGGPVNVEMAYAFSPSVSGNVTRLAPDVVTSNATYPRLPYELRMIPLMNNSAHLSEFSWETPVSKENPNSRFYYSRYCALPIGVNGVLVYGSVVDKGNTSSVPTKVYNGSLIEHFPASFTTVADIEENTWFELEQIYKSNDFTATSGVPAEATALADCLNTIANTEGWKSEETPLKELFTRFTNDGYALPGSAASVKQWIQALITLINPFLESGNKSYISDEAKRTLLTNIKTAAQAQLVAIDTNTYPRNLSLPDGAAVLQWVDVPENNVTVKKFVPQLNTTTLANINSIARFTYPASLYYFINSEIRTSENKVNFEEFYQDKATWNAVLDDDNFKDKNPINNVVTAGTRSVVVKNPVQFAVAQLKVKIKAGSATLKDAGGDDVTVGTANFPLKGVIVCDQLAVNYAFSPRAVNQSSVSDDEMFIYDSQVKDYYLAYPNDNQWTEACNTLVLQSHNGQDVHILLEFENNTEYSFQCIDGSIYPHTRFYLIGEVEAARYTVADPNVNDDNKQRVFTKDYITTVNMTVSSLAKAYNVPPNLLSNQLEIGVETTPQWEAATPTVIRVE